MQLFNDVYGPPYFFGGGVGYGYNNGTGTGSGPDQNWDNCSGSGDFVTTNYPYILIQYWKNKY